MFEDFIDFFVWLFNYQPTINNELVKVQLHNFGQWWVKQPPISPHYNRFYDTDGFSYLFLWEGNPGRYDRYGDWADDDHFYNHVIKGIYDRFSFSLSSGVLSVRNESGFEAEYQSPEELEHAVQTQWRDVPIGTHIERKPPAGLESVWESQSPNIVRRQAFIDKYQDPIVKILTDIGEKWIASQTTSDNLHLIAYGFLDQVYLGIWQGTENGVWRRDPERLSPSVDHSGYPHINTELVKQFKGIAVQFKQVPPRFSIFSFHPLGASYITERGYTLCEFSKISEMKYTKTLDPLESELHAIIMNTTFK